MARSRFPASAGSRLIEYKRMLVSRKCSLSLSLVELVAGHAVAGAEVVDLLAERPFGRFKPRALVVTAAQPRQVLPDQRGNRGAALRRNDPGVTIGFFVECNCDVFHDFCVTVKTGAVKAGRLLSPARRFGGAMPVLLGAIADDFTGATDLCNTLVRRGMRSVQLIDVPAPGAPVPDAEAVVVALKSRTIPASEAVAMSLDALAWLKRAGARQILFKYCSTFDSTALGNI